MNSLLIRQYQDTKAKYLKYSGRLQRSYNTGEFYRLSSRKQNWLIRNVIKLWEKLKMLEKQLKLAIAAGTFTLLLTFSDAVQAQPNFVLSPDKNPLPPPLVHGLSPLVNDVDMDGDFDILTTLGDGFIMWYKNVGTVSSPDFAEVPVNENPFLFADSLDIETWNIEALVDIDGDGDIDVFVSDYYNIFFKNTGTAENPHFEPAENPLGYSYLSGIFVDIDGDGDFDLLDLDEYGHYDPESMSWIVAPRIRINKNIGTPQVPDLDVNNPVYLEIADQPDTINYFSQFSPMDFGNDNDIDFLVGMEYYNELEDKNHVDYKIIENIGTIQNPQFAFLNDSNNPFIELGIIGGEGSEIFPVDLDDDGDIDALLNEYYIGLSLYRNIENALVKDESIEDFQGFLLNPSYISPAFIDYDGDGDLDLYTFNYEGDMQGAYYENTGNANNPEYTLKEDYFPFLQAAIGDYFYPVFVDIDSDGDLDCFVWYYQESESMVQDYYKNTGTQQSPNYQLDNNNPLPVLDEMVTIPAFADFDADGDMDMILVNETYSFYFDQLISYYRNTGTPGAPMLTLIEDNTNPFKDINDIDGLYGSPLVISDLDRDGDFDIFFSDYYGNTGFLENIGTPTNPLFVINNDNNPIGNINMGYYGGFSLVDLDGDGDKDLLNTSLYNTIVNYYVNTDTRINSADSKLFPQGEFLELYPNPASDYCTLSIDNALTGLCDIKIIDIYGQVIKTESLRKINGQLLYQLDISSIAPGLYFVNVTQGGNRYTSRLVIE
jgi:hypothetical protein